MLGSTTADGKELAMDVATIAIPPTGQYVLEKSVGHFQQ